MAQLQYDAKLVRAVGRFSEGDRRAWNKHMEIFTQVTRGKKAEDLVTLFLDTLVAPASTLARAVIKDTMTLEQAVKAARDAIFGEDDSLITWDKLVQGDVTLKPESQRAS
jgi:hypothetical protein